MAAATAGTTRNATRAVSPARAPPVLWAPDRGRRARHKGRRGADRHRGRDDPHVGAAPRLPRAAAAALGAPPLHARGRRRPAPGAGGPAARPVGGRPDRARPRGGGRRAGRRALAGGAAAARARGGGGASPLPPLSAAAPPAEHGAPPQVL